MELPLLPVEVTINIFLHAIRIYSKNTVKLISLSHIWMQYVGKLINNNTLDSELIQHLGPYFKYFSALTKVEISTFDAGQYLLDLPNLKSVKLDYDIMDHNAISADKLTKVTNITFIACGYVSELISEAKNIVKLSLRGCHYLSQIATGLTNLRRLTVRNHSFHVAVKYMEMYPLITHLKLISDGGLNSPHFIDQNTGRVLLPELIHLHIKNNDHIQHSQLCRMPLKYLCLEDQQSVTNTDISLITTLEELHIRNCPNITTDCINGIKIFTLDGKRVIDETEKMVPTSSVF